MLMSQSGGLDAFGQGQSPSHCPGNVPGEEMSPVASGAAWGQTGTGICQEEPEPDGGMGSILSLSLGGSGMKLLHPGNALLLPRLFSIPG